MKLKIIEKGGRRVKSTEKMYGAVYRSQGYQMVEEEAAPPASGVPPFTEDKPAPANKTLVELKKIAKELNISYDPKIKAPELALKIEKYKKEQEATNHDPAGGNDASGAEAPAE